MSTRVLFDYQTFHTQHIGGISRYFVELFKKVPQWDIQSSVALRFTPNKYLKECPNKRGIYLPFKLYKVISGVCKSINQRQTINALKANKFDVFHPTYYAPYFLPFLNKKPFVLTVHDMTHERFPESFSVKDNTAKHKAILCQKASQIIAISEFTKTDIVDFLNIDPKKITVIYHGIEPRPLINKKTLNLPENYLLYVGERRATYKNFTRFAEAFANISKIYPELKLVMTGRAFSHSEERLFSQLNITSHVHLFAHVSDSQLFELYRYARAFVYPSLNEGFGLPILEAFSQQTPVILSRASCFPEIAGDAAFYFDPFSVEDIVQTILYAINNDTACKEIIKKGLSRLTLFNWETTAQQTAKLYEQVCKSN